MCTHTSLNLCLQALSVAEPEALWLDADMFAKQNAQSANPKVRMLAAEKRFKSAEGAVQRAEKDLERAAENIKKVKQELGARVCPPNAHPCCLDFQEQWVWFLLCQAVVWCTALS